MHPRRQERKEDALPGGDIRGRGAIDRNVISEAELLAPEGNTVT